MKKLVVYFSHSGNTREIAGQIQNATGGDIFEIQPVAAYPVNYNAVVEQARQELKSKYKPAIKSKISNIGSYDIIFIAFPNWWSTFPAPVKTFLLEHDLRSKTIIPICTHEGSGMGRSVSDITKLCPGSTVLSGLPVRSSYVGKARDEVMRFLHDQHIL
jgi:flavodoxin